MFIIINYGHIKISKFKFWHWSHFLLVIYFPFDAQKRTISLYFKEFVCLFVWQFPQTSIRSETSVNLWCYVIHSISWKIQKYQRNDNLSFTHGYEESILFANYRRFNQSKKKPVGHSIGMIWNATGSFFLIKEYTHLKYELKTNKRAEMLFSLEDVYIAANLAHSSDTSIYTANK